MTDAPTTKQGLELLREKFPANLVSRLPKPTKTQTDALRADRKTGIRCTECGGWHHPAVVHLDYVGHAALTTRLLDCDPEWNWEPVATTDAGLPAFDATGGMWIRLTVCGVTRLGYGDAPGKSGGNAIKEVIGDALRNAAMRFGAALDLWHKGELHANDDAPDPNESDAARAKQRAAEQEVTDRSDSIKRLVEAQSLDALIAVWKSLPDAQQRDPQVAEEKDKAKAQLSAPPVNDEIPDFDTAGPEG